MPQRSSSPIRLGTRGSRLALAQTAMVRAALADRGIPCEIVTVKTTGDRIRNGPLADAGGKGLFTKELEEALLANAIDIAIHSMKDVPAVLPAGLAIAAVLPREDPHDALISPQGRTLGDLAKGARVGTSSVRRRAQLARARPDLECTLLRGNVDTRLSKVDAGAVDAAILALAGLRRLGREARADFVLSTDVWLPAPAQGAIGLETRQADARARDLAQLLNDTPTAIAVTGERAFLAALNGSCRTPIAALATIRNGTLQFRGEILSPDGREHAQTQCETDLGANPLATAHRLGRDAGLDLKPRGSRWLDL